MSAYAAQANGILSVTLGGLTGYPMAAAWFTLWDLGVGALIRTVRGFIPGGGTTGGLLSGFINNSVFISKLQVYSYLVGGSSSSSSSSSF